MALGYKHPNALLKDLNSLEIAEWIAYYNIEPFGYTMDWLRTGVVASMIANVNRKKGTKPAMPEDFVPNKRKKRQTITEQRSAMQKFVQWAKSVGKTRNVG